MTVTLDGIHSLNWSWLRIVWSVWILWHQLGNSKLWLVRHFSWNIIYCLSSYIECRQLLFSSCLWSLQFTICWSLHSHLNLRDGKNYMYNPTELLSGNIFAVSQKVEYLPLVVLSASLLIILHLISLLWDKVFLPATNTVMSSWSTKINLETVLGTLWLPHVLLRKKFKNIWKQAGWSSNKGDKNGTYESQCRNINFIYLLQQSLKSRLKMLVSKT